MADGRWTRFDVSECNFAARRQSAHILCLFCRVFVVEEDYYDGWIHPLG